MVKRIAVTTGDRLDGYEIDEYLGIVRGIVVRAQTITQGIRGALSSILGGNIRAFEEVCEQARSDAYTRMIEHAIVTWGRCHHRHALRCHGIRAGRNRGIGLRDCGSIAYADRNRGTRSFDRG